MTHVIYIMEVIGGYILPLTSSLKVRNNDTCKYKLQIILFPYNYTYNMATNLIYYGGFFFFLVKRKYINYELIKRKRVLLDTSKAKASSTYAGALEKEIKSGLWSQPVFASKSTQPFASLKMCLSEQLSNLSIKDLQSVTMVLKKALGVVMELASSILYNITVVNIIYITLYNKIIFMCKQTHSL